MINAVDAAKRVFDIVDMHKKKYKDGDSHNTQICKTTTASEGTTTTCTPMAATISDDASETINHKNENNGNGSNNNHYVLELRDIRFQYADSNVKGRGSNRGQHEVLRGVSFTASPGGITAICGKSGCGKSTLVGVIAGLYNPTAGLVTLTRSTGSGVVVNPSEGNDSNNKKTNDNGKDKNNKNKGKHKNKGSDKDKDKGTDLSQATATTAAAATTTATSAVATRPPSLLALVGVVEQSAGLFSGTISENIGYGSTTATGAASIQDIERAARLASAHAFTVDFADGYETQVGERGQALSGGQRMRVALARALLKDPVCLLMNDATASR